MVLRGELKMAIKITTEQGEKSKKDKVVKVDEHKVSFDAVSEQVKRLVDKYGQTRVKKELGIPEDIKHREINPKKWTLNETKNVVKELYKNEDTLYPKSKGKEGSDMLKKKLSRDIFRHIKNKRG